MSALGTLVVDGLAFINRTGLPGIEVHDFVLALLAVLFDGGAFGFGGVGL